MKMGKRMEKIRMKVDDLDSKFDQAFYMLDIQTKDMYIMGIMKEDRVSREEAINLIETNPMYSMGLKTAQYRNRRNVDLRTPKKIQKERFLASLTPEELELYRQGPGQGYWRTRKMEKQARKAAEAKADELKDRTEISDEDLNSILETAMEAAADENQ